MMVQGTWQVWSAKDPRWNASGRDIVGCFSMPVGAEKWIEEKKKELGEPPEDLQWSYMKD